MDREFQSQEAEVELEGGHDDQILDSLEEHAEEHESEEIPDVNGAALDTATERGREQGGSSIAAPGNIDDKLTKKRHKQFEQREKRRAKATKKRTAKRAAGKDWTGIELAQLFTKDGAQGVFVAINKRQPAQAVTLFKTVHMWSLLVFALPDGKLTPACRQAIDQMIEDNVFAIEDAKMLFKPRFNHAIQDVGSTWTSDVLRTMWRQLALLPDKDVTLSTAITTFDAISGGGAFGPSWEAPDTINTVQIGQDIGGDHERLEHTVRHEIGHGVHTELAPTVNTWLQNDMQFWFTDFDTWINDLGGYPADFTNSAGTKVTIDDAWKNWLREVIVGFTGNASWSPTRATPEDGLTPDGALAWAAMPAKVRNACAQSTTQWYNNYENFQKNGDKHYFLNHWYHRPFTIGPTAFNAIKSTNDTYTAMSEKEFFANCYAEYFENPEGARDHTKWGGTLPSSIKSFFKTCIVGRNPYDKFKKNKPRADKNNA